MDRGLHESARGIAGGLGGPRDVEHLVRLLRVGALGWRAIPQLPAHFPGAECIGREYPGIVRGGDLPVKAAAG